MASHESNRRIRLDVTDFGPISSAKIELRPLTVFVGPSNAGKSYMAMLIYALHRAVEEVGKPFSQGSGSDFPRVGSPSWYDSNRVPDHVIEEFLAWAKELSEECHAKHGAVLETKPLPTSFASTIDNIVWGSNETSASIGHEIIRCFGVANLSSLIRRNSGSGSNVDVRIVSNRLDELLKLNLEIRRDRLTTRGTTPTTVPIRVAAQEDLWIHQREAFENNDGTKRTPCSMKTRQDLSHKRIATQRLATELILPCLTGLLGRNAYYIPAERSGIIHAHSVLDKALVASNDTVPSRHKPSPPLLSGVLSDFLKALSCFGGKAEEKSISGNSPSTMIESKLLGGSIHIDQNSIGYPSFTYRPADWKENISLMQTSSMVSDLAPIVHYLQRIVHDGDLLIIEEPESHIHPQHQVALAKIIAEVVRNGIRVIVTTHSDWFLDQIGNLVLLSELPLEDRHTITDGTALEKSEVGVWLFEDVDEGEGSHVTEIDIDPNTGLYPVDIGHISDALYNESAHIFNRMQGRNHDQ